VKNNEERTTVLLMISIWEQFVFISTVLINNSLYCKPTFNVGQLFIYIYNSKQTRGVIDIPYPIRLFVEMHDHNSDSILSPDPLLSGGL
jgi:hypothetical protein